MEFKKAASPSDLPPDEYLTPEQAYELQNILIDGANALLHASRATVTQLSETREVDPDSLDLASSESDRDFSLRLAGREQQMLKKIRYALDTFEEGAYGTCESCGNPISYKRLIVRPVARHCIDCKTQQEQLERGSRAY